MKKGLIISLLAAIFISGCGENISTTDTGSEGLKLSEKEIAVLDKEYSFKTKALTVNYLKRKLTAFIASDNGTVNASKIIKELEYAMYKAEPNIPFKAMMAADHDFYNLLTGVEAVIMRRAQNPAFDLFISESNPAGPPAPDNIIYVNANLTTGNNDGTSWENAYQGELSLKTALSVADAEEDIWMAAGTYKPSATNTYPSLSERSLAFRLKPEVNIYGGFAGTETSLNQRTPDLTDFVTVLSGDLNNSSTSIASDSCHVVIGANDATIDGVTIKFGNTDNCGSGWNKFGGGMHNDNASPIVSNVTFSENTASSGGGMYNNNNSLPKLTNVTFSNNTAGHGGGMFNTYSSPVLTNVTFLNNKVYYDGGGMYIGISPSTLHNESSLPTLANVTFSGNTARDGGGMFITSSTTNLTNVIFSGNKASQYGGGVHNANSTITLTNATFSGNTSTYSGGGMYSYMGSNVTVKNSIFWGNSGTPVLNNANVLKIGYSIVQGGINGLYNVTSLDDVVLDASNFLTAGKNLALDPLFISPENLDLQSGSPAIDAGTDDGAPATDINGTARPQGAVDIGAYEFGG